MLVFILGFLSCMIFYTLGSGKEIPRAFGLIENSEAPGDWVSKDNIHVYSDKIVIDVERASLSSYADSGSMKPVLDKDSNGIRIIPKNSEEINVGDIISFEKNNELIVHRVIEKGKDNLGAWFITKGDSNSIDDGKIRFSQIRYVTIGVLY